jgi:intracellular sulfur oxidation DsrE/DsrF family protein
MNKDELISDEQLNAFTDGELEADEENRVFTLSEENPDVDARLCQQRKLKELVQHAYRDVPEPHRHVAQGRSGKKLLSLAMAAAALLFVGVAGGWFASRALDAGAQPMATAATQQDTWLIHVASSDPLQMQKALARAEELMADSEGRVEIVANEGGLDLLRSDLTPYAGQIRRLAEQDVLFFACNKAIQRLEEQGISVRLVPEANTQYSALDRVVLRMQQGWTYEKI